MRYSLSFITRVTPVVLFVIVLANLLVMHHVDADSCTTVTPTNVISAATNAGANTTLCLSPGNYGQVNFTSPRTTMVTLRPATGATVTIYPHIDGGRNYHFEGFSAPSSLGGVDIIGGARNIQITNDDLSDGGAAVFLDENLNAGILFDGDRFVDTGQNTYEGRLSIRGAAQTVPVGVQVKNSLFKGAAGCSDGIQIDGGAYGVEIGPNNEFTNIEQDECHWAANPSNPPHVDSIQLNYSSHTQIYQNYIHDSATDIMAPDTGDHEYIHDNVFVATNAYRPILQFGHNNSSTFTHNVVEGADFQVYVSGADSSPNHNVVMQDNVMVNSEFNSSGCVSCTIDHNLFTASSLASGTAAIVGAPRFNGGASPTTYGGFALESGALGSSAASDGSSIGISTADSNAGSGTVPTDTALNTLLAHFNSGSSVTSSDGDYNGDGSVDLRDLSILLSKGSS